MRKLEDLTLSSDPRLDAALKFEFDHECAFDGDADDPIRHSPDWDGINHSGDYDHVRMEHVAGDSGGDTKYGIDRASHPGVDIANLDEEEAALIYTNVYWNQNHCGDMALGWGEVVCDIAVNNGRGVASHMVKKVLNLDFDAGSVGPFPEELEDATHEATKSQLGSLLDAREQHYRDIVTARRSQRKFLDGWLNRNRDLRHFVADITV